MRELEELRLVGRQPICLHRKPNLPLFEFQTLLLGAFDFSFFWVNRQQPRDMSWFSKRLQQAYAARHLRTGKRIGSILVAELAEKATVCAGICDQSVIN